MRSTQRRLGADLTHFAKKHNQQFILFILSLFAALLGPSEAHAMHLGDGVIPGTWCVVWTLVAAPFIAVSLRTFATTRVQGVQTTPLVAMVGAAVFAISCMPVPVPFIGTCSHPCGTGLAAVLVGPQLTIVLTLVALLLQALFLAHGGVTTLGADVLSMGIAGGIAGYGAFRLARCCGVSLWGAGFLAGLISDWATYATTALELALGLHGDEPISTLFFAVCIAFAPTQIPLGLLEGLLTAQALTFVHRRRPDLIARLGVLTERTR